MVDGVLYVATSWNKTFAFDAASGKTLWEYDPKVPAPTLAKSCCDAISRGVAVSNGRIFADARWTTARPRRENGQANLE